MTFILLAVYKNIKKCLSCRKPPPNDNYQELQQCAIPTTETEVDIEAQEKQIKWIKDNVKFYSISRTTVYHEGSAYDILMACRQYNLDYHDAPRLFQGAARWNIRYLDMAEMMSNVDKAQTQPPL